MIQGEIEVRKRRNQPPSDPPDHPNHPDQQSPTPLFRSLPNLTLEARVDCYGRIISAVHMEFSRWQQSHPELAGDERNQNALRESVLGLALVFDILSDYKVEHRDDVIPDSPPVLPVMEIIDILKQSRE